MKSCKVATPLLLLFALFLPFAGCGGEESPGANARSTSATTTTGVSGGEPTDSGATTGAAPELRTLVIEASSGEEVEVRVEIADNIFEQYIGLRRRKSLAEDRGMLFVHSEEAQRSFTMEDTLIPLSIAFMDSNGRIIDIQDMKPLEEGPYVSAEPAQYALEVNRGFFEERGVEVGDRAELPG